MVLCMVSDFVASFWKQYWARPCDGKRKQKPFKATGNDSKTLSWLIKAQAKLNLLFVFLQDLLVHNGPLQNSRILERYASNTNNSPSTKESMDSFDQELIVAARENDLPEVSPGVFRAGADVNGSWLDAAALHQPEGPCSSWQRVLGAWS
jgi:hypothetical protein